VAVLFSAALFADATPCLVKATRLRAGEAMWAERTDGVAVAVAIGGASIRVDFARTRGDKIDTVR
jgi:hypothetical protein